MLGRLKRHSWKYFSPQKRGVGLNFDQEWWLNPKNFKITDNYWWKTITLFETSILIDRKMHPLHSAFQIIRFYCRNPKFIFRNQFPKWLNPVILKNGDGIFPSQATKLRVKEIKIPYESWKVQLYFPMKGLAGIVKKNFPMSGDEYSIYKAIQEMKNSFLLEEMDLCYTISCTRKFFFTTPA